MEICLLNLVDSSFEHVLHSYGLHLVSTYKYEISNCFFDSIFYLLDNHLSSLELKQSNLAHLFDVHQGVVTNEHQYVTRMASNASMGGLLGDFTIIFWRIKYLQRSNTFGIKYQNTLCLDVAWIFNLPPYI
jgi:hypothetical protein